MAGIVRTFGNGPPFGNPGKEGEIGFGK